MSRPGPAPSHVLRWIRALDEDRVEGRFLAARFLQELEAVPPEALDRLVELLEDPGVWREDWIDWGGAVVGCEDHELAPMAARALAKGGPAGLEAARRRAEAGFPGARRQLAQVTVEVGAAALAALGEGPRARLYETLRQLEHTGAAGPLLPAALRDLDWAEGEAHVPRGRDQLLVGRLAHPDADERRRAAEGLADAADPTAAVAALAAVLLGPGEDFGYLALGAVGRSLARLPPRLETASLEALVDVVLEDRLRGAWPHLLVALGRHGRRAARLAPRLREWVEQPEPRVPCSKDFHHAIQQAAARALAALEADLAGAREDSP